MVKIESRTRENNYATEITSNSGHTILSDEPKDIGGQNKGMSPDELIIAALASCTSATLKMYAQRKEWALHEVHTSIELTKGEKPGDLPTIQRTIQLKGDLDEQQKERMLVIANKCPVHKILSGNVSIDSALTE